MVLMRREAEEMEGLVLPSEIEDPSDADFETSSVNADDDSDSSSSLTEFDEPYGFPGNSDENEDEAHGMD